MFKIEKQGDAFSLLSYILTACLRSCDHFLDPLIVGGLREQQLELECKEFHQSCFETRFRDKIFQSVGLATLKSRKMSLSWGYFLKFASKLNEVTEIEYKPTTTGISGICYQQQ